VVLTEVLQRLIELWWLSAFHGDKHAWIPVVQLFYCANVAVYVWAVLRLVRYQLEMTTRVNSFSVRHANCFCETDRVLVESNIVGMMREVGLVQKDADEDAALVAFDKLVHSKVPAFLNATFGRAGISYCYLVALQIAWVHLMFDELAGHLRTSLASLEWFQLREFLHGVSYILCWKPILIALGFDLARFLVPRCNSTFCIFGLMTSVGHVLNNGVYVAFYSLNRAPMSPLLTACIWFLWFAAQSTATLWIFRKEVPFVGLKF